MLLKWPLFQQKTVLKKRPFHYKFANDAIVLGIVHPPRHSHRRGVALAKAVPGQVPVGHFCARCVGRIA